MFASTASNLVADDGNNASDVYFFEMDSNGIRRLERLSVSIYGEEGNAGSYSPSISDDGRRVTFATDASNLVELDRNGQRDVLIKDTQTRIDQAERRVTLYQQQLETKYANLESLLTRLQGQGTSLSSLNR